MKNKKEDLLKKVYTSISELNHDSAMFRTLAHDKKYIESVNQFQGGIIKNYLDNEIEHIILQISYLLDTSNNNISLKNLIKKDEELVKKFNDTFCSENNQFENPKDVFKYKYNDDILKILKYRNKTLGHRDEKYILTEENTFLYKEIYAFIEKLTSFFEECHLKLSDIETSFDYYREDVERNTTKQKIDTIIASRLLADLKKNRFEYIQYRELIKDELKEGTVSK